MMGYLMWVEALAACASGGNQYAIRMLALKDTDRRAFIRELMAFSETGARPLDIKLQSTGGHDERIK